jgi:hypothetical protein
MLRPQLSLERTHDCSAIVPLAVCGLLVMPITVWAQAATGSIAGVVRDTSGAFLPGVTIEAVSPALIEKVRTVVTDGAGAYRIVELRPGTYSVTFSLPGFGSVRREGIELTSSFTATVNAELMVGNVAETITVTGQTPVVDISSARQQTTISRDVLDAIPTTKRLGQYASFIPGATYANPTFQDSGGTAGEGGQFGVHGQRAADEVVNMDGLNQNMFGLDVYSYNSQTIQEVVVETGGTSAEAMTGGVQLNIIPKDGGNTWSGSFASSFTGPSLQAKNLDDDLRARGLQTGASIKAFKDHGGAFGGPIARKPPLVLHGASLLGLAEVHPGHVLQQEPGQTLLRTRPRPRRAHQLVLPRQQSAPDLAGHRAKQDCRVLLA